MSLLFHESHSFQYCNGKRNQISYLKSNNFDTYVIMVPRFLLLLLLESLEKPKNLQLPYVIINDFDILDIIDFVQEVGGLSVMKKHTIYGNRTRIDTKPLLIYT